MALPVLGLAAEKPIRTKGTLRLGAHDKNRESYAMVRDGSDELMLSGDIDDIHAIKRTRQRVRGDFLWFRRGGTAYVVQDSTLLAQACAGKRCLAADRSRGRHDGRPR